MRANGQAQVTPEHIAEIGEVLNMDRLVQTPLGSKGSDNFRISDSTLAQGRIDGIRGDGMG